MHQEFRCVRQQRIWPLRCSDDDTGVMSAPSGSRNDASRGRNAELIARAASSLNPHEVEGGVWIADVGAAVEAANGAIYTGASIGGHLSICAEQGAFSQMVSYSGPVVARIVAVWRDPQSQSLYVIPPCGRCREAMRVLSQSNLDAIVVLGTDRSVPLRELLPFYGWHAEKV